jgi:hypothetical protein
MQSQASVVMSQKKGQLYYMGQEGEMVDLIVWQWEYILVLKGPYQYLLQLDCRWECHFQVPGR